MEGHVEYTDNATVVYPAPELPETDVQHAVPTWAEQKAKYGTAVLQHFHTYTGVSHEQVVGTDRILVYRVCDCSQRLTVDLLPKDQARDLYIRLRSTNV